MSLGGSTPCRFPARTDSTKSGSACCKGCWPEFLPAIALEYAGCCAQATSNCWCCRTAQDLVSPPKNTRFVCFLVWLIKCRSYMFQSVKTQANWYITIWTLDRVDTWSRIFLMKSMMLRVDLGSTKASLAEKSRLLSSYMVWRPASVRAMISIGSRHSTGIVKFTSSLMPASIILTSPFSWINSGTRSFWIIWEKPRARRKVRNVRSSDESFASNSPSVSETQETAILCHGLSK